MESRKPRHSPAAGRRPSRAMGRRLFAPVVACAVLSGCANFWDDVTSRDFKFKELWTKAPDPMWVIQNSNDGDKKSKALRSLKEPLQNGGTQKEQDVIVQVLVFSATKDPQPLCRLAAIDSLQHFKDPRAAAALDDAFFNATSFSPEIATAIQCQALVGLGENGNPVAVKRLVGVINSSPTTGTNTDTQQEMDKRIAAARALAHFPQYQAAEALVTVLRTQQDVALRDRAVESLREMTGQDLPPDAQAWADFLHKSGNKDALAKKPSFGDKFLKLISFP